MSSHRGNRPLLQVVREATEETEELVLELALELALELEELAWWWSLNTSQRMSPHIQKRLTLGLLGTA